MMLLAWMFMPATLLTTVDAEAATSMNGLSFPEAVGGDFSLLDQDGQTFSRSRLEGKYSLLFFGYTHCPDVCPTTLIESLKINRTLPPEKRVQIVFISLDPQRDTPEVLKHYLKNMDPSLIGLTGSPGEVAEVAKLYRAAWQRQDLPGSKLGYAVNHSAYSYLLDRNGKVILAYPYGTAHSDVLQDLKALYTRERPSIARETLSQSR